MSETIDDRLEKACLNLSQLVTRLNGSEDYELAADAQSALQAVAHLSNRLADYGLHECDWVPDHDFGQFFHTDGEQLLAEVSTDHDGQDR